MINTQMLREKIKDARMSMEEVAGAASMDRSTLYRRLASENGEFTVAEAIAISKCLKLSKREIMAIFFEE